MDFGRGDLLTFGQRMIALIDSTRHNSTYKFATLMAVIDVCTEKNARPDEVTVVPINEIAHRVVAYYWNQTRDFAISAKQPIGLLRQNQQAGSSIPHKIQELRCKIESHGIRSPEAAREKQLSDYERLINSLELILAQQPLTHLQTPGGKVAGASPETNFIFDSAGFHKKMTRGELKKRPHLVLRPNAGFALRVLSPLLKPLIEQRWSSVVLSLNSAILDIPDLTSFLFCPQRKATSQAAATLRQLQNDECFYCEKQLDERVEVDHVIPWSRIPLDGAANLVLAHQGCNNNKSNVLPAWLHVERAVQRPESSLATVAKESGLPVLRERTVGAANAIYSAIPPGTVLWRGVDTYELSS